MTFCNLSNWGLSYSYSNQSISNNKDILMIVGDDNKFIIYDENDFVSQKKILFPVVIYRGRLGDGGRIVGRKDAGSLFWFLTLRLVGGVGRYFVWFGCRLF